MGSRVAALVPAAGQGARMGTEVPKQFLTLGGAPLLVHALRILGAADVVTEIILVVPKADYGYCQQELLPSLGLEKPIKVVIGGARRQDSVRLGLQAVSPDMDFVLVHDAARPFVTLEMVEQAVDAAKVHGASIVAIPMRDTVKRVKPDAVIQSTLDREGLWLAQTPQVFRIGLLVEAHQKGEKDGVEATDDAFLVERLGYRVWVVPGSLENIKITKPEDRLMGEAILAARANRMAI